MITIVGINHRCQSLSLRERVVLSGRAVHQAHKDIVSAGVATEVVWVATCGRTECVAVGSLVEIRAWFIEYFKMSDEEAASALYAIEGEQALQHWLRVACGLDSQIVGEPQIIGQLKQAFLQAQSVQAIGPTLNYWLPSLRAEAKKIRAMTGIGICAMSMPSMIKSLTLQSHTTLHDLHILIIGTGSLSQQHVQFFAQKTQAKIYLVGRNRQKTATIAQQYAVEWRLLNELPAILNQADVVISATSSPLPLVGQGLVQAVQQQRQSRPLLLFDLAMPRDIEASVAQIDGVQLYSLDALSQRVAAQNMLHENVVCSAEQSVKASVHLLMEQFRIRDVQQVLTAFRQTVDALHLESLAWGQQALAKGLPAEQVLARSLRRLSRKMMHGPTAMLRKAAGLGQAEYVQHMQAFLKAVDVAARDATD